MPLKEIHIDKLIALIPLSIAALFFDALILQEGGNIFKVIGVACTVYSIIGWGIRYKDYEDKFKDE